jgi:hypothetical protein
MEKFINKEEYFQKIPCENKGRVWVKFKNSGGLIYSLVLILVPTFFYYIVL